MAVDGGWRKRYHLAEVNVAVLREPLDAPATANFVAALEPINQLADHSPGFVWRLQTPEGDATSIRVFDDDRILVNLSLWESLETLWAFTYASRHLDMLRRRREWFHRMAGAHLALWWGPGRTHTHRRRGGGAPGAAAVPWPLAGCVHPARAVPGSRRTSGLHRHRPRRPLDRHTRSRSAEAERATHPSRWPLLLRAIPDHSAQTG